MVPRFQSFVWPDPLQAPHLDGSRWPEAEAVSPPPVAAQPKEPSRKRQKRSPMILTTASVRKEWDGLIVPTLTIDAAGEENHAKIDQRGSTGCKTLRPGPGMAEGASHGPVT